MIAPGVCRHCGCRELQPCWSCRQHHDGCAWTDRTQTVCMNSDCVMAEIARQRTARRIAAENACACTGRGHHPDCKYAARKTRRARRKGRAA